MKRLISTAVFISLLINIFSVTSYAGDFADSLYIEYDQNVYRYSSKLVDVVINGKQVETGDMPAIIVIVDGSGRTLVPAREVFESEAIGATVDWNGAKQEVYITYADKFIVLQINSKTAYVNGVAHELDVPAKLIRDLSKEYPKTMIPLRFVSEVLDFKVDWDSESFTAILTGETVVASTDPDTGISNPQDTDKNVEDTENEGEKLDSLTDASASRPLPTPLKNNPVQWSATEEQLKEIDESYVDTEIENETHPETQITDVDYKDDGEYKQFIVESESAMSDVNYFIWDNKFIMDISNSTCELPAEDTYEDNPILSSIRASQYSVNPNSTRIVFDLRDGGNKFELSFNEDRTDLIVTVMDNSIHDIYLGQNEIGDFIRVTGVAAPDVKMFRLSKPDRIVIDFPNTKTVLGFNESEAEGQYVTKIRTAQFDPTITRVVVETDGQADYEIQKASDGETVIQFMEPGYKNIEYDNSDSPTISLDQDEVDISVEGVIYDHDYVNRNFGIILSENYGELFGDGSLKVNDGIIDTIDVTETADGHTRIDIKSTTVYEFRVEEIDDKIEIKAYKPKQLFDKVVVIDAGHGGKDPGALANGLVEKTLNLQITYYLKEMLDEDGTVQVYYTRLDDVYPTLQERCDLANEIDADFFLSIHNNAFNPSEKGTETLFFPWNDPNALSSPDLAEIVHKNIIDMTGNHDRGMKSRENLFVLKNTTMPAVLIEGAFLTNTGDAAKLKEDLYLRTVAEAIYKSIIETFQAFPTKR